MKTIATFLCFCLISSTALAQLNLKPSIGIGDLPGDEDMICEIPEYLGSFEVSGLSEGDTIADFNLYDLEDNNYEIAAILQEEKPVLLISSSYTCPVFRGKVPLINQIASMYDGEINIFIIYTVEAHPSGDISPYFGFENVTNKNIQEGILYGQPTSYGERKLIVSDMLSNMTINVPVLIDGLCNEWWSHFGPAPNNAYLIDTDGTVYSKHGWFNKFPNDIICEIDNLLADEINDCETEAANGTFEFSLKGDSIVAGTAGQTLFVEGVLENNSSDPVHILVKRMQENIPGGWESSICLDVCYGTDVEETTIVLQPGESQTYTMYFYTDENPADGMIRMGFRNVNNSQNKFIQNMYASTMITQVNDPIQSLATIESFPNPVSDETTFVIPESLYKIDDQLLLYLYNYNGQLVKTDQIRSNQHSLDVKPLEEGIYFLKIFSDRIMIGEGKLVVVN